MATAQTKFYEAATSPVQVGRGTVATHLLTFAVDDTGTVGVAAAGSIVNNGNSSEAWSITPPSGVAVSPSSGTLAASGTQSLTVTASTAGTYSLTLVCAGATITGNPQSFVASAAPSVPTTATLSGSTSATVDVAVTYTVTLNSAADQTYTITPSASDSGVVSPGTRTITSGNTTGTFTATWGAAGAGRTVDFTISPSLTRAGRPITVTVAEPAAAGAPAPLSLTSSVTGTVPFAVGYAFCQGDVPSGDGVAITGATAQATIKNTWPDGSAKFAIIAGTYASTADTPASVTIEAGTASSGTALATSDLPAGIRTTGIEFDAGAFGSATFSGTDFDSPFETWVSGHRMSCWVYRKQIGSDPHLVAWMEVRLYDTDEVEVLPWVENGYLLVSGPTNKSATYTFSLGGTTRYSGAIDIPNHCRTPLISGTALSHWLGTDPGVVALHDTDYVQATGLVPAYFAKTPASAAAITTLVTTFTPLQKGDFDNGDGMGGGGAANHIGLLPEWEVVYLTAPSAATRFGVLANAYSLGRYPLYYRDESDSNRWARLSQHANLQVGRQPEAGYETTPEWTGTVPAGWDLAHAPSAGFLAYLMTGSRYHLDTVQACASCTSMQVTAGWRQGALGLYVSHGTGNTRHVAWGLRNLAQAVAATPDADTTVQGEFRTQYENNVDYYHTRYVTVGNSANPIRFVEDVDYNQSGFDGVHFGAPWQQDYLTASLGYALDLGMDLSAPAQAQFEEFFHWHAPSVVGRFGGTGADEFLFREYDVNTIATAPDDGPDYETGTGPWYADWGECYDATFGGALAENSSAYGPFASRGSRVEGHTRGWFITDTKATSGIAALAYCVKHGAEGAIVAYGRLTENSNWWSMVQDMDSQPLWAVQPAAFPAWWRPASAATSPTWVRIEGTSMSTVTPSHTARLVTGAVSSGQPWLDSFCGIGLDRVRGDVRQLANGGHGDYYGNEVIKLDLLADAPQWQEWFNGSQGDVVADAAYALANYGSVDSPERGYYLDDGISGRLPASGHSYGLTWPIVRHGTMLRVGDWSYSPSGAGWVETNGYDLTAAQGVNGWVPRYAYRAGHLSSYTSTYAGPTVGIANAACHDPRHDKIYQMGSAGDFVFTPSVGGPTSTAESGGSWASMVGSSGTANNGPASAVDTRRGRLMILYGGTDAYKVYDIDGGTGWTTGTLTGTGVATLEAASQGSSLGMTYVPRLDAFLVRMGAGGGDVLKIDASGTVTAFTCEPLTVAGGASIPATFMYESGGATPYEGVYNRWQYVPRLRGVFFAVRNTSDCWFMRAY